MPPSVTQIVQEFSLEGGVEGVAFELQRAWRDAGIDSVVLTCATNVSSPDVKRVARLLARVRTRGAWRYAGRFLAVPAFTLAASWHVRRVSGGRLVLSHGDSLAGDVCVVHAVNRASLIAKCRAGQFGWLLNPMHLWVEARDQLVLRGLRFRRYVAVSERVAEELERHHRIPRGRIAVIPNGVNLERFSPVPDDRAATRRALGVAPDAPLLLFVGHEFGRKGLEFVLEALTRLDPRTKLLVVGAGDRASFATRARSLGVEDRVVFTGPRDDLPCLYRAADAFVFPTAYEASPLVCMEAMACGLPVFATRVGGIESYLRNGVNGCFVPRDGAAVAASLAPALADPRQLARLRAGALATAREYGWPVIAARYLRLFEELAREGGDAAGTAARPRRRHGRFPQGVIPAAETRQVRRRRSSIPHESNAT